jgi:quinol monooxygenase YgiN
MTVNSSTSPSGVCSPSSASLPRRLAHSGRVNIFERWESQAAVETFRRSGPGNKQRAATVSVSVAERDIADARALSGKGRA